MATLFMRHRVADYARWKAVYDAYASVRDDELGVTADAVYRDADDPAVVLVMHEFADAERARAMATSGRVSRAMADAGVVERPQTWLIP